MSKNKILKKKRVSVDCYTLALERMEVAFNQFDHIATSFSGGKDSTAVLHVALEVARAKNKLPLRVFYFDEEAIPMETEQYVRRVFASEDVEGEFYCTPVKHRNACSYREPFWWPWSSESRHLWCREYPADIAIDLPGFQTEPPGARLSMPDINGYLFDPAKYGNCGMVMGIRAAESLTRQRAVSRRSHENYIIPYRDKTSKGNLSKIYPCYDWTVQDVWTGAKKFGWDFNEAYNIMAKLGLTPSEQRCCPPYGEEPIGRLWTYKHLWPALFDKMLARVHGVNTAMRYGTTELYGYGAIAMPESIKECRHLVKKAVLKHPPETRPIIIRRVKENIGRHYSKTSDLILPCAPHPDTGVSWTGLYRIAVRGDYKNRKQLSGQAHPRGSDTFEAMSARYNEEQQRLQEKT